MITNLESEIRAERDDRPYAPPRRSGGLIGLAVLAIAAAVAAWLMRGGPEAPVAPAAAPPPVAAQAPAPAAAPAIQYPVAAPEVAMRADDIPRALTELLGAGAVRSFLQTADFARRAAATIDSLGREHAPVAAWPVQPIPGAFSVEERPDGTVIAAGNAERYTPFVHFVASVDADRAVALYRRMYPLLQGAYRELGFGDRYLNDRVVQVIDLMLAAPEPAEPPLLQLTEVKGPVPSTRPWVRYQYADPQLESLAAGQKILVRVGLANERALKAKLHQVRKLLVSGSGTSRPAVRQQEKATQAQGSR
jgi:hypothetical protein